MSTNKTDLPHWLGILLTLLIVIIVRELCVLICHFWKVESAANIIGLVMMFCILFAWRLIREKQKKPSLPNWLTQATNRLLLDSGFAFLPVSAGAGLLLFSLGDQFWRVFAIILISTLIPLWAIAKLTGIWLKNDLTKKQRSRHL
ncbi:MAG: CidA/LrgA family protein [Gammaproteobacteria bacterium]|nr:MAG: CidA/LrgA family protein [Gammaproteobacteria bacterium]